jgi:dCTP deaminase
MVLGRKELKWRMSPQTPWPSRLVVEPLFLEAYSEDAMSASIDFHLGNRFTILRGRRAAQNNPLAEDPHVDVGATELFIPMGREFSINPGQIVLGTTLEWFRFPVDLMAYVVGRSIWGRRGLVIVTASAVQPGSCGTITLEMATLGEVGVRLKPGAAIGQLFFHEVRGPSEKEVRMSTFAGVARPTLGEYTRSPVERFLMGLDDVDNGLGVPQ